MKFSFKQIAQGKKRKLNERAKKVGRLCSCMCKFYLPASLSAKEFQRRGRQTQVHAPISQMSGAMFLFFLSSIFCLENMISTNTKDFPWKKWPKFAKNFGITRF
jgi:hypothetical protein